jgi:restriction endonuclease Mrr
VEPEAVIERARGSIDESLLTSTGGGLLGRKVLADEPLLAHLRDDEALQYLLAGAAAPTRVEDGHRQELETEGSYRTLLAVTDDRLLLVAGSADGDRAVQFDYRGVADLEARRGLLTDTVVIDAVAGPTWEVAVGTGSDVAAAAEYATERAGAAGEPASPGGGRLGTDDDSDANATGGSGPAVEDVTTAPDGSATIDSFLQDATTSESEAVADVRDSADVSDSVTSAGPESTAPPDRVSSPGSGRIPPAEDDEAGSLASSAGEVQSLEGDLPEALFRAVVEEASVPAVEGYASGDVERLVDDVEAHHQRVRDHLAAGELEAARGAAATVAALAREGARLAEQQGATDAAHRLEQLRGSTRRLLLSAALDVEDLSVLSAPEPAALKALLQGVDPTAFEHLVADLWGELGYQTAVTQSSKDKGVDVVARQSTPVEQTVVIQAKRYGTSTKVGREEVQQYASLHRQEPEADLVVVVTTGEFTGPAQDASSELDVKLVDGDRLVEILLEHDCYELVARYA